LITNIDLQRRSQTYESGGDKDADAEGVGSSASDTRRRRRRVASTVHKFLIID